MRNKLHEKNRQVIRTLLQCGASLDLTSKFDRSPMDIALQNEKQEIVEILQESLVSPAAINSAVASIYSPPHSTSSASRDAPVTITVGPKVLRTFPVKKSRTSNEVRLYSINLFVLWISTLISRVFPSHLFDASSSKRLRIFKLITPFPTQRQVGSSRSKDPTLSALDALEEAAGNAHVSEEALQFLQAQGISVHESALQDDGSIVTSALETGQTISLSDAGRLALKGELGTDKVRGSDSISESMKIL